MNIAFIPARCGSKSIPFKNIKKFCGRPLIYWNLKALQASDAIDVVHVSTDCENISKTVKSFNFSKVKIFNRSANSANDTASTELAVLEFIDSNSFDDNDLFILVQATSPLTTTKDFDEAINMFDCGNFDSLLTCVRSNRFFWFDSGKPVNYNYKDRKRRQDFDGMLMENGAFYINTVGAIVKNKNRIGGENIGIYEMNEYTSVEIDEVDDWVIAEHFMKKYILNDNTISSDIKLFLSDVDGTLTDSGMYYGENGNELKKFNTQDGKGFELLRNAGIKTGLITSETTDIVANRAKKIKSDYLYQGVEHNGKLEVALEICKKEGISIKEVAYIGDDINCKELLENVGMAACPFNANKKIKSMTGIIKLSNKGGDGAVREFIDVILESL